MIENPNYYAIIPANVRYDKGLKANEKLLYGEITCLTHSTGVCYASNDYFANLYGVSKETISRWVSNLKKCGYIDVTITYKNDGKTIDKRVITLLTKKSIPYCEKNQYPIDEKVKDNNTSINNTSNNIYSDTLFSDIPLNTKKEKKKSFAKKRKEKPTIDEVIEYFKENGYSVDAAKKAFAYYDTANWHDASGKQVISWKQKMISVWFREENKVKQEKTDGKKFDINNYKD